MASQESTQTDWVKGQRLQEVPNVTHTVSITALRADGGSVLRLLDNDPNAAVGITHRGKTVAVIISLDLYEKAGL